MYDISTHGSAGQQHIRIYLYIAVHGCTSRTTHTAITKAGNSSILAKTDALLLQYKMM